MLRLYNYERLGLVPLEATLAHIRAIQAQATHPLEKYHTELLGVRVVLSNLRLRTFATHGVTCSCCGLTATVLAIERCCTRQGDPDPTQPYHLNLYGLRHGQEVLFTQDHTVARALGGTNDLSNTTPMCQPCNARKSQTESDAVLVSRGELLPARRGPRVPSRQLARQQARRRRARSSTSS